MTPVASPFSPKSVELAWQEQDGQPRVKATCWFEFAPIRHVVRKHVATSEPWTRILDPRLIQKLRAAGWQLAAGDCEELVNALARQLTNACSQPRLCRFQEIETTDCDASLDAAATHGRRSIGKILFVLPSGNATFVRVEPATFSDQTVTVFLTAFFPRHVGWVAPARVAATTAARYVQRWAQNHHPSGGLLLPDPDDAVTVRDEVDSRVSHRRWFRFISPKTWGFRLHKDGRWAWIAPNPAH